MKVRALDSDGDWIFGRGKASYKKDEDCIAQNIKTRLQSWRGDCFFSTEDGVDYNGLLGVGTKDLLDSDIKRVILQTEGVLRLDNYDSELDTSTRGLTISCSVLTIYGTINLEV